MIDERRAKKAHGQRQYADLVGNDAERRLLLGSVAAVLGLAPLAGRSSVQLTECRDPHSHTILADKSATIHQRTYYKLARF